MKFLSKTALWVFLFVLFSTIAMAAPPEDAIRRAQALAAETIPHLELKKVTFEEALAAVSRVWEKNHPKEFFPVGVADYKSSSDGYRSRTENRLTVEFKNIPYLQALRHIGILSGRRFASQDGIVMLEGIPWIEEDWFARELVTTDKALSRLNLKADSDAISVREAFRQYGVKLEDWTKVEVVDGNRLIAIARASEHEQIAGILFLLEQGYQITK